MPELPANPPGPLPRTKYVRAVGPRLRILLGFIFGLFAILGANSVYLATITALEWFERDRGITYQNYFYQFMFLAHLALGLLIIGPVVVFGLIHMVNTRSRPNRRTKQVGYALFGTALALLISGVILMRVEGFELKSPSARTTAYWLHVLTPIACIWLYILHRLTGPRIRWKLGLSWAGAVGVVVAAMVVLHRQDPRLWNARAPKEGEKYFKPSSARTASGNFIPSAALMNNEYCLECHKDSYAGWYHSAHRFSSFNNPFYLFAVNETRQVALNRDGSVQASRWCAGCHDPVPFFSGAFDDPQFDMVKHPTSQAGISCVACHSIVDIHSATGNGDYTIEEPIHYPWAFAPTNSLLYYLNKQMVKAKPAFHKKTFLKPLHKTTEFCSVCHKVGIPKELNHYKEFLRGQNHYDTFLLTGISGHSARSFYYPEVAKQNCSQCHMPLTPSEDFGARFEGTNNFLTVHDHLFPGANTALPHLRGDVETTLRETQLLTNSARLDIFGVRQGDSIDSPLIAPLRPRLPKLKPGRTYLLEAVVRNLKVGHPITQGTTDSNELWVNTELTDVATGTLLGRSGGLGPHREVDRWAHFLNTYMLDKDGNRIDRRNPQDIFIPLYNNQIPPSGSAVVHYRFTVPEGVRGPLRISAALKYRKFDTIFFNYVFAPGYTNGLPFQKTNDLPIVTMASDALILEVEGGTPVPADPPQLSPIPEWQRWNDYGVGLFNKGDKGSERGELRQAEQAFLEVEKLGRADGPLNLARIYIKEGRLEEGVSALAKANDTNRFTPPAPRWTTAWLNGIVNKQNGRLDEAIASFRSVLEDRYPELDRRKFDFRIDYEVINELGLSLFERAKLERTDPEKRREYLMAAVRRFEDTLAIDSENVPAHYNLSLLYGLLGDSGKATLHHQLHERYRVDDNARDRAVAAARLRDPAADHAAQTIVIYDLQRPGTLGMMFPPAHRPNTSGDTNSLAALLRRSP